jgi:hypothetical protein
MKKTVVSVAPTFRSALRIAGLKAGATAFCLLLFAGVARAQTWSFVNSSYNFSCTETATTCSITGITSTTADSVWIVALISNTTNTSISSVYGCASGSTCSSNTGGGTWVTSLTGSPWSESSSAYTALSYNVGNSGGNTVLTVTRNISTDVAWYIFEAEWKCSGCGTISLDQVGTAYTSSSCSTCDGASFSSLATSKDLLLDIENIANTPSNVSSPYTISSDEVWFYALGSGQTSAPTFTQSPAGTAIVPGLAFNPGSATVKVCTQMLLGAGPC